MAIDPNILKVRKELCSLCEHAKVPVAATNGGKLYGVINGSFCDKSKMLLPKSLKKEAYGCPVNKFSPVSLTVDGWNKETDPKISIITCVFKVGKYIEYFLADITNQTVFESDCELILIDPGSPDNEYEVIKKYMERYPNIIYKKLNEDPGLYECWNIAIRMAKGKYITNANPDDAKKEDSLEKHMKTLDDNPEIDVVCAPVKVTQTPLQKFSEVQKAPIWFNNRRGYFSTKELLTDNLPHNNPMWRKNIHDTLGYFDESNYGPLADWEFWLRCSVYDVNFKLLPKELGLYLIEPESHNRRFPNKAKIQEQIREHYLMHPGYKFANLSMSYPKKIKFHSDLSRHSHRSGWAYAVSALNELYTPDGVLLDDFVDLNFAHLRRGGPPYSQPWIGFVHNPPNMPEWFHNDLSPQSIMKSRPWKKSIPFCKGLFTFSEYHREWLQKQVDVPVNMLYHPTETPQDKFNFDKYMTGRQQIIQIGWWLRRINSIYMLPTEKVEKVLLQSRTDGLVEQAIREERRRLQLDDKDLDEDEVSFIGHLPNEMYDDMLSKNIVFMHLWDSSANNGIIECIVRNTPVLVNRLPAVEEYLGANYPFYFDTLEEAAFKADNPDLVLETHQYLTTLPIKEKLKQMTFVHDFVMSDIYQSL